jgi:hypothetical protein
MSFWSRLGDGFDKAKGGIGAAWTWAQEGKQDRIEAEKNSNDPLSLLSRKVIDPVSNFFWDKTGKPSLDAVNTVAETSNRSLSTFGQVVADDRGIGSVFNFANPTIVKDAWSRTGQDVTDTEGNPIEGISAGQSLVGGFAGLPFDSSPDAARERRQFFHDTWQGQLSSGAVDLATAWYLDPLVLTGKGGKAFAKAQINVKPAERANALRIAKGETVLGATRREQRAGARLADLYTRTDGMSAGEIALLPEFASTTDAGAFAYFFERANKSFMGDTPEAIAARHSMKNDVWGAALGERGAVQRLRDRSEDLANELERLTTKPMPTLAHEQFSWADGGQGMFNIAQETVPPLTQRQIDGIEREMARLERIIGTGDVAGAAFSPTTRVGATLKETYQSGRDQNRIRESWSDLSMAGRPVRVVTRSTGARLPGHVNIKDPNEGLQQVTDYVTQLKYFDGATKQGFIDSYVRAATENGRRAVVDKIEAATVTKYGVEMGLSPEAARKLLDTVRTRRAGVQTVLSSRLYSAAPEDKFIAFHDPEDDITHAFSTPLLRSQIEEHHALSDPRMIEAALKKGTNRRLFEGFLGQKTLDNADAVGGMLDEVASRTTKVWKDAALFRLAYPLRVQIDTQGRLITHMGMMQYLAMAKSSFPGAVRYAITRNDDDIIRAARKAMVTGKQGEDDLFSIVTSAARNDEEITRNIRVIQSEDGSMANLGNEISQNTLRRQRGSNGWGRVETEDPNWYSSYLRAVQQIKSSPTAMKAIQDDDLARLKEFVNSDPAARKEWMALAEGTPSQDEWLAKIIAHVNHYAPTAELKQFALKGRVSDLEIGAVEKAFSAGAVRAEATSRVDELGDDLEYVTGKALQHRSEATATKARVEELAAKVKTLKGQRTADAKAIRQEHRQAKTSARSALEQAVRTESHLAQIKKLAKGDESLARSAQKVQNVTLNPEASKGMTVKDLEEYFSGKGQGNRMPVHGEKHSPLAKDGLAEWHERNRRKWYKWASDVPETIMGRSPLYAFSFKQHMTEALQRLDGYGPLETIPEDVITAMRKGADRRARRDVANVLFDTSHTSNLARHFRYLSPFFSAWEDTMKKWGGLFYDKPWALQRFGLAWDAPNAAGMVVDSEGNVVDSNGDAYGPDGKVIDRKTYTGEGEYVVLPKFLSPPGLGGGGRLRVRKDSVNIIFQGQPWWLPGFGPMVQVPTNELVKRAFPKEADDPVLRYVLPFGVSDNSVSSQFLPAWARQARNAFGGTREYTDVYSMFLAQETARYRNGERKTQPTERELSNRARNWFILGAAMKNASAVSVTPTPRTQFYIERARQYRNEYFADPKSYEASHGGNNWQAQYLDDFPEYFEMSMTLTKNETGIQATDNGYDAIQKYHNVIAKNPEFGWMIAGPENTGEFSAGVYNWMKVTSTGEGSGKNFLSRLSPDEALKKVQAEKGWIEYIRAVRGIDVMLEQRGMSIRDKGAADLAATKRELVAQLSAENPAWREDFLDRDGGKVEKLITVARSSWKDSPELAKRQDQVALQQYIEGRNAIRKELAARKSGIGNTDNADLAAAWTAFTTQLVRENLGFEEMWSRVLERDDLNKELLISG